MDLSENSDKTARLVRRALKNSADHKSASDGNDDADRIKQPDMRPRPAHPHDEKREQEESAKQNQRQELLDKCAADQKRTEQKPRKGATERNCSGSGKQTSAGRFVVMLQSRSPPKDIGRHAAIPRPNSSSRCALNPASARDSIRRGTRATAARKKRTESLCRPPMRRRAA